MLAFARSLGDFGVTLMVAGDIPGETQTAALAIYDAIQAHRERAAAGMVAGAHQRHHRRALRRQQADRGAP